MIEQELDKVSGGIFVISEKYVQLKTTIVNSMIDLVSINPQPLPP